MINWSDIVGSLSVNGFHTIGGKSFAYKNNVRLNAGPAINVVGNPATFFSGTTNYNSNINDGRTRNATRMFIYNALRAESDYTDAQAAAYGNTSSTDEFLIYRTTPGALVGSAPWPVHSTIVSGSRTAAIATSRFALEIVAIRDRSGHVRAWKRKTGLTATTAASFATAYDKLTDAQIRTEFGLPAASTPLAYSNQTQSITQGTSGAALPAATGGTAPYNYALGTAGSTGGTPATSWGPWTAQGTAYPRTQTNATNNTLFRDDSTNKVHVLIRESNGVFKIYELNLTTGRVSNPVTLSGVPGGDYFVWGADATPDGTWYVCGTPLGSQRTNTVYKVNKTTGACTSIGTTSNLLAPALVAVSNSELLLVTVNASRLHQTPLTLNAARTSFTAGTAISSGTLPNNTVIAGVDLYNNRLFIMETGYFGWVQAKTANAAYNSLGTNVPGVPRSLVFDGRDMYSLQQASSRTNAQLYKKTATSGSDARTGFSSSLPAGITFNATTRVISVASTVTAGLKALRLRIRDSASPVAELIRNVALTVVAAVPAAATGTFNNQTQNVSATSSQVLSRRFTAATGGTGTITYQLRRPHPAGVTLTGTTITLPAALSGTQAITIRAIWTSGSSTAFLDRVITFNITRSQAPASGTFAPSAKSFSTTHNGSGSVTIDAASGGTGTVTYQLRRPHATGLSLSGRTLSIASNTPAGTHSVTIRAIWTTSEGSQYIQAAFNLVVTRSARPAASGTFHVPSVRFETQRSDAVARYTFSAATGGFGTITYSLVSPPTGVTISGRQISFAASVVGATTVTVRATWTSGSTTAHIDQTVTFTITRSQAPVAGTLSVSNKTLSLVTGRTGTVTIEAAAGGTGSITYSLVSPPTGITISGRVITIGTAVAAGAISLTARATWTTSEGTRTADSSFTITLTRTAAPRVGLAANTTAKNYADLTTADKDAFYEWTWTTQGASFYGNPTRGYLPGAWRSYSGTNKGAAFSGWFNGHVRQLLRSIDSHWCSGNYSAKRVLLRIETVTTGSAVRWTTCGTLQGTGDGDFSQGSGITDIVIEDQDGRARYFKRTDTGGAATYAAANFVEQTGDSRFYNVPQLFYDRQVRNVARRQSSTALPEATGGTSPYTYTLGQRGTATPATAWADSWVAQGAAQTVLTAYAFESMFFDDSTGKMHLAIVYSTVAFVYEINLITGARSNLVRLNKPAGDTGVFEGFTATPNGRWYVTTRQTTGQTAAGTRLYLANKSTGVLTLVRSLTLNRASIAAVDNTTLIVADLIAYQGESNARFSSTRLTLNAAGTSVTSIGTPLVTQQVASLSSALAAGYGSTALAYYNGRVYILEGGLLYSFAGAGSVSRHALVSSLPNLPHALGIAGLDFYTYIDTTGTSQLYKLAATNGSLGFTGENGFSTTLPTGITFNAATRVISVANNAALGAVDLFLRIRDSVVPPAEIFRRIRLTVQAAVLPPATAGSFNVANKTLALTSSGTGSVTIEAASGGVGTVAYSLITPPAGITMTGNTITVGSGVTAGAKSLTVRATWTSGATAASLDATFTLTVTRTQAPVAGSLTIANKTVNLTSSGSGTAAVEAATGGTGTITYSLSAAGGTSITMSGRTLSIPGTQTAGTYRLAVTATWTTPEGSRGTTTFFNITINRTQAPVAGSFTVTNKTLNLTSSSTGTVTIEAATGGTGTVTYSLLSPPSGITISGRTISVASSVTAGAKSLTARATWTTVEGTRTVDASFNLTVNRTLAPATGSFTVTNKSVSLNTNTAGSVDFEAATGGTGTITYSLSVNGGTSVTVDGTKLNIPAGQAAGTFRIAVTATWTTVEGTAQLHSFFTLTITRVVVLPPAATGTFTFGNRTLARVRSDATASFTFTAASGGTGAISYSLVSPPTGVTLSGRTISIAPPNVGGVSVTVRATWTSGSSTAHLDRTATITVPRSTAPSTGAFAISNKTLNLGSSDSGTVTIEAATGGVGTVTYSLLSPPLGITMSGRVITVAGTVPESAPSLTVRATWTTVEGTVSLDASFTLTIDRPEPAASAGVFSLTNQTLSTVRSDATATYTFPAATGGVGDITYSLVSPPAGVTLSNRTISIAPPNSGGVSVTVRATWTSGNSSATVDQTIVLNVPRTQAPVTGQFSVANIQMQLVINGAGSYLLPAATGGVGTITYDIVAPPDGYTLLVRTLNVAGRVAAGEQQLTLRATWTTVEGSRRLETNTVLTITRSDTPPIPEITGVGIPEGAIIKCFRAPDIRTGDGENFRVYADGEFVGIGNSKRR